MLNYFFVPGNRLHKIPEISRLKVDEIVIDLEDAVKISERKDILQKLSLEDYKKFYIRVPLYDFQEQLHLNILETLIRDGYHRFVLPKINSIQDFDSILSSFDKVQPDLILLVETPNFLLQLFNNIQQYKEWIKGLSLGSHDFMALVGGEHRLQNLEVPRQTILYMARSIDAIAIDIASMQLKDAQQLQEEIKDGFTKGYDAKFYIHPWQLEIAQNILFYTNDDLEWAMDVDKKLKEVKDADEFNPIIINGRIIEKPHLRKAEKILKYYESK